MDSGHCTCNLDSCPICRPLVGMVHVVYPPAYYSGRIAQLEGELFTLHTKLKQTEVAYQELNMRLMEIARLTAPRNEFADEHIQRIHAIATKEGA